MKRNLPDHILNHPTVQAVNPHLRNFIKVRPLSPKLNIFEEDGIEVVAVIAFADDFGHLKLVPAFGMMEYDYLNGVYVGVKTLVVPTSGNTGHAIALLAEAFGIEEVKPVIASDVPDAKVNFVKGVPRAQVVFNNAMKSVDAAAREQALLPGHYLLDQYGHPANAQIHEDCTGPKILAALGSNRDRLGAVAIAMGSAGTVTGVSHALKNFNRDIMVFGVRPKPDERVPGARDEKQMNAVVNDIKVPYKKAVDDIVEVSRKASFVSARRLSSEIYPYLGPSSGLAYVGLLQYLSRETEVRKRLRGKLVAFICPDGSQFYPAPTQAELDPNQGVVMTKR